MSEQDKTRAGGGAPSAPASGNSGGAAKPSDVNIIRRPEEPTVVPRQASPTSPPHSGRTLVGVGAQPGTVVLGNAGAPQRDVKAPSTMPAGTPLPGSVAPPKAQTIHAQPPGRAKRDSNAPSFSKS